MKELPPTVIAYQRTNLFTQDTVPSGVLKNHSTKDGVWGVIRVEEGQLEYMIEDKEVHILSPEQNGIVEPTVSHHVRPLGKVSFFVEFYK